MKTITSNMLKSLRKSRNLTQEQLGVLAGMSKSQISKMEKGTLGSEETILRLLDPKSRPKFQEVVVSHFRSVK